MDYLLEGEREVLPCGLRVAHQVAALPGLAQQPLRLQAGYGAEVPPAMWGSLELVSSWLLPRAGARLVEDTVDAHP